MSIEKVKKKILSAIARWDTIRDDRIEGDLAVDKDLRDSLDMLNNISEKIITIGQALTELEQAEKPDCFKCWPCPACMQNGICNFYMQDRAKEIGKCPFINQQINQQVEQIRKQQELIEKLAKAGNLVEGSFSAAEAEGLAEALNHTEDERLKDLMNRRICFHLDDLRKALSVYET